MELGGHAPVVVCEDSDVDEAAAQCAAFKFRNAGQVCIAPNRFYVHENVVRRFTEGMVAAAKALVLGDSQDPATTMGPLTLASQRERSEALCREAISDGARGLTGGRRPADRNKGYFFEPTVLADVPDTTRIMHEEPFGPVAPITTFRDLDEAIERANSTPYGLAAYAFTRSQKKAEALSRGLHAGMVGINTFLIAHAEAPFGGIDHSGMGREGGRQAIHDYLNVKMTHFMAAYEVMAGFTNPLRRLWADGRSVVNGWIACASILSAEALAAAGWDSITIDLQHGTADYAGLLTLLPVIERSGAAALVRVPWLDEACIMRALDAGAQGIIAPMIETAADARRLGSACLYAPEGARSFGPVRARLAWGDDYAAVANRQILPIAMIESRAAVDNLDEIAATPGLAGLYIGPADLSLAHGLAPGFDRQ